MSNEVIKMATDKPRYTVSVDNDLFQRIEDFRFERRFQTRSEATVELIRLGLETLEKELEAEEKKPDNNEEDTNYLADQSRQP
jgi:Arc/MetJ-type ribon-helix-helix transcriptional regulator